MRKPNKFALLLLASTRLCAGISAAAQEPAQPQSSSAPAQPPPAGGSKDKNKIATKPAGTPDAQAPTPKPSTADDNPFPEDVSKKAAADAKAAAVPDAPTPGVPGKGASRPDGSSSLDGMDKLGLDDPARRQLKLQSPDGSVDVYDPKRATEDVRVGKFYMQTGYYKGAYSRFKDATSFDHENAEAVFWLAEAARKMNLEAEAAQNYQLYLAAVPDGPSSKAARKALGELPAATKP